MSAGVRMDCAWLDHATESLDVAWADACLALAAAGSPCAGCDQVLEAGGDCGCGCPCCLPPDDSEDDDA